MSGSDNQTPKPPKTSTDTTVNTKDKRVHEVKQIAANVYEIQFQKSGKARASESALNSPASPAKSRPSSRILKAEDLRYSPAPVSSAVPPKVTPYFPSTVARDIGNDVRSRVSPPTSTSNSKNSAFEKQSPEITVGELKRNLNSLKEMHLRLRVMLRELEDFVQS